MTELAMLKDIPKRQVRRFYVYKGNRLVLTVRDRPGRLASTAPPPAGQGPPPSPDELAPTVHPFADAQAHDAASEHELRRILGQSATYDGYLTALIAAGYDIASEKAFQLGVGFRILDGGTVAGAAWEDGGQFACLWWQPAEGETIFERAILAAMMTVYKAGAAEALLEALSVAQTFTALAEELGDRGFHLEPLAEAG